MKCAIMQPTYLPWLGYFELMMSCDCFVFFDDVQFVKKSWQQRNRIKSTAGELLLTVPVLKKGERDQKINEVRINNRENWRHKHLASIENNYRKAPFIDAYLDGIRDIYRRGYEKLIDLDVALIDFFCEAIGIKTPRRFSSELQASGDRNLRIVEICRRVEAKTLYDAAGAADILDPEVFVAAGVELVFQDYRHPVYHQLHGPFLPYLSVLDLLLNEGEKSGEIILSGRT